MKINDIVLQYNADSLPRKGICRLRTFVNSKHQPFLLLTELENNPSSSITNSIEVIFDCLSKQGMLTVEATLIEHYESSGFSFSPESFDKVLLKNDCPSETKWESLQKDEVISLIESNENEFDLNSPDRIRILNESEKISSLIDPSRNLPRPEDPDYVLRSLDIESKQITKKSIENLIQNGSNERQLQELLSSDLSIFAEIYASPSDQYICFSEFPWDNGFIDFVIFSGISRMDIILIEVKGANFNLLNKGHYKKMSSKMETAIHQIRQRIGSIYKNLDDFRSNAHSIRNKVESGQKMYNSLLGPQKRLEVDSNKNINIYPVVIGGVTTDDINESKTRHEIETTFTPRIKIESWNSWLRKIQRD